MASGTIANPIKIQRFTQDNCTSKHSNITYNYFRATLVGGKTVHLDFALKFTSAVGGYTNFFTLPTALFPPDEVSFSAVALDGKAYPFYIGSYGAMRSRLQVQTSDWVQGTISYSL